jgi:hypothetical protein
MKRMSKLFALLLAFCMVMSVSAFASGEASGEAGIQAGTYTDGVNTLIVAADGTFTMDKTGQNMEGEDFVLTVTGVIAADGTVTIDGMFDGDINLIDMATEEQMAADLASVESALAAGAAGGLAGTYTDGVNTLIVAADGTFTMDKTGQNMEGEDFVLTLTGTITEDGVVTIDGMFDGDINLVELATEEQLADDLASVEAAFAAGKVGEAAGGDTSEEAYHAYLKEYVAAVPAVSEENYEEFAALIDASDYTTMPADMLFNAQWWGYAAMTYDEFVAANGVYEIPAFDPSLTAD